jgi:YD repeat-containing protein
VFGKDYLYRIVDTDYDGAISTTDFNSSGLPTILRKNGSEQRFEYDLWGRVTRKETNDFITELTFDSAVKKVCYVRRFDKDTRQVEWSRFSYSPNGDLLGGTDFRGLALHLKYDQASGKITGFQDETGTAATFHYTSEGRMSSIDINESGRISIVQLNADGKPVADPTNREVTERVRSMLHKLFEMVRLAGTTLDAQ